jgi:hypothetical protein
MAVEKYRTGTVENLYVPDDDRSPRQAPLPIPKPTMTTNPLHQEQREIPPLKKADTKGATNTNTKTRNCEPKNLLQAQGGSDNKKIDNFSWKMGKATPTSVSFYRNSVIQRESSTDRIAMFDWDTSRITLIGPFTSTESSIHEDQAAHPSTITPDHDDSACLVVSDNIPSIVPLLSVSSKNTLIIKDQSSIGGARDETLRLETPVKKKYWTTSQVQQHPSPWKAAHSEVKHRNDHDFFQSVLESPSRVDLPGLVTPPLLQRATSLVEDMHVVGDMGEIDLLSELPYS